MSIDYCFSLPGITCVNCIKPIEDALKQCKSVPIDKFVVGLIEKKLTVSVLGDDFSPTEVRRLLHELLNDIGVGYVDIDIDLPTAPPAGNQRFSSFKKVLRSHWLLGFIGIAAGVSLLTLSLVVGALPLAASISIALISIPLTLILGAESYKEAAKKLFKMHALTMDTLFAISTLTVIVVSVAAFFVPWLPMMFDAGLLIFGFRHIGFGIEKSIKDAMGLGVMFKERLPKNVNAVMDTSHEKRPLDAIKPDDLLIINPGEIIPVDGLCYTDDSLIVDTIVTGSTMPRKVGMDARLLAGMYVAAGGQPMRMRVTATVGDSYLARLDESIARANHEKAPLETATNKILQYFIPAVIIVAILSALIIGYFFSIAFAIQCAVAVLVSACPCTLGFITPLAVKIGMNKAAEHGVRFKSAKALQEADQIDAVVFDLNGTLTEGAPSVRKYGVKPGTPITTHELLSYFAVLEKASVHPMAKAICAFVHEQHITPPPEWQITPLAESNHSGLTATINDECYTLGNQNMMNEAGIDTGDLQSSIQTEDGDSVIYLARANKVIGYVILADKLRPNARHAIDSLKLLGKDVYICTGTDEATALRYARMLGIPEANTRAGCVGAAVLPSDFDKKAYISELKNAGLRVAMVGDAANDALAIAVSHFGIAVKSRGGDEKTQQEAGAVIQSGSLLPAVSTFAVAKQTVSNIKQNLLMSLGYNIVAMMVASGVLLAVGVMLNPSVGVALMILQTSLILYNAYCFKQQKLTHLQQIPQVQDYPPDSYSLLNASMPSPDVVLKNVPKVSVTQGTATEHLTHRVVADEALRQESIVCMV